MKEVHCRLLDLPILHPRLLWETIILAGASVLEGVDRRAPYTFLILAEDIPGFGSEELILTIDPSGYGGLSGGPQCQTLWGASVSDLGASVSDFVFGFTAVRGPQCQTLFLVSRPIRAMISLRSSASRGWLLRPASMRDGGLSVRLCFWFHGRSGP